MSSHPRLALEIDEIELPLRLATQELERIGRIIDELRGIEDENSQAVAGRTGSAAVDVARSLYRLRRRRDECFGTKMFSDTTWDILLDLFIAAEEKKRISISSACIASSSPATTALRHLSGLVKNGLVRRIASPEDGRTVWVELTSSARDDLEKLLRSWTL